MKRPNRKDGNSETERIGTDLINKSGLEMAVTSEFEADSFRSEEKLFDSNPTQKIRVRIR